ncbi:hypothetical protein DSO57_1000232 [Entomophthora muscae]|uniref:Uncharacterized protein n=1 Tax=Entomophthora muscae TaxID=34485 RepID=A0ACC2U7Y3_9FUNG|nr:hypothetical protein DSO57_1000232 [Entomophthora muscae]
MDSVDSFSVNVPTLDGSLATLRLKASGFGVVRRATVFTNLCSTPEPTADLGFVEGWFGMSGLRLVNYCKYVQTQGMEARLGIVSGSSGIGKSFLVSRIASALGIPCHTIHSADLSLKKVHSFSNKPALLVLENVHEFFGCKADSVDVLELLNLTNQMPKLLVLALTFCPGEIHASLLSKVAFHIELEPPTNAQRRTMLSNFLAPAYSFDTSLLDRISEACPGLLMADLYTLVTATLAKGPPLLENFLASKRLVHQTHSLPQSQKIPPVFFSQIGGLDKAKAVLKRLSFRLLGPSSNIVGGKGALMYGPPGTGKTLLGKALATEASANFLPVRIPDLIRGEIGASEKALSRLFSEARSSSPCIMFLDELDALFVNRANSTSTHGSRLAAQFILELDGLDNSVIVLATTNHPLAIDRSVLRPGRIDHHIYLPPPSPQERVDIFKILIPGLADDSALLEQLKVLTDGFTGADLSALKHRAQVLAYHRSPDTAIASKDVLDTLNPGAPCPLIPSVSDSHLEEFKIFQNPC